MAFYLHRPTPLHDWTVYRDCPPEADEFIARFNDGEILDLPDCHWYSQAQAEADRLNGKGNSEQGVLKL